MKRTLLLIFSILLSFSLVYSFEVHDLNDNIREYFSVDEPNIIVKTSKLNETVSISTNSTGVFKNIVYNMSSCDSIYCLNLSLLTYLSDVSLVINNTQFEIEIDGETKTIFLDASDPSFNLNSYIVDPKEDELKIYFNYSDNYEVQKVDVYEVVGASQVFIQEITSNTITKPISDIGFVKLLFKVSDVSGNVLEKEELFEITDIFEPVIKSTSITLNDDLYEITFTIEDDNLKSYNILQKDINLSGNAPGSSYTNTIKLPYLDGSVKLVARDDFGNAASKTLSLDSNFDVVFPDKYSNEKEFRIESKALFCELTRLDSTGKSREFEEEDDNEFVVELNIDVVKNYILQFYCEGNGYRKYYERDFYYDINDPQGTNIELEALDNGDIEISWDKAEDDESPVDYEVYRDGDEIYTGSSRSYEDDDVEYPNEYTYFVRVIDQAGNYVDSLEEKITPKKTKVQFSANLEETQKVASNTYNLRIEADENSKTNIVVKNSGVIIFTKLVEESVSSIEIPLDDGVNEVIVEVTDNFGNVADESYFITYSEPAEIEIIPDPVVIETAIVNETTVQENILEQDSKYGWIWIVFWVIVLIVFMWYFLFNEDRLKERVSNLYKKDKKARPENDTIYRVKKHKDEILHKHIQKTKEERRRKHDEIEEQKREENKPHRELTDLEKKKMEDIGYARNRKVFHERETKKKEVPKELKPATLKIPKFFSRKKENEMSNDPMSNYLKKQSMSRSWNSSNHYRQSYYDKLKKEEIERQKKIEEEKKLLQLEIEEEKKKEQIKREKEEKKRKKELEIRSGVSKKEKIDLDDYLGSRTKKKRRFYFAQKEVEKDIDRRLK